MSQDTPLAGMPTKTLNEIFWGRKGLPVEFYGSELIAEALFEALKTMDRKTMDGFVHFNEAFQKHRFGLDNIVVESAADCISPPRWFNPDGVNLSLLGLEHIWGIGTYGTEYGQVWRSVTEMPAENEIGQWVTKSKWDEVTCQNDVVRVEKSEQMPLWQISHMRTKRVFLTQNGRMFVVTVEWEAVKLAPEVYKPNRFRATKVTFQSLYSVRHTMDILEFVIDHGLNAGLAVLSGLKLALQSSNYRLREALEPNEKAEEMLAGLLSRVSK